MDQFPSGGLDHFSSGPTNTTSDNRAYLTWKIREVKNGGVRVGPPLKPVASGPQQVLSLRVDEDVVPLLDAAWEKHGMRSRMDLVRRALHREFVALGELEAAAKFALKQRSRARRRPTTRLRRLPR